MSYDWKPYWDDEGRHGQEKQCECWVRSSPVWSSDLDNEGWGMPEGAVRCSNGAVAIMTKAHRTVAMCEMCEDTARWEGWRKEQP